MKITADEARAKLAAIEAKFEMGPYEDTPEGYDDSPDQGVHRYDGGLGDGSFL